MMAVGVILDQPVTDLILAQVKRGGGNVDQDRGALIGQILNGIEIVEQALRPELRIVPGVFADGNAQGFAFEPDHPHPLGRIEMAGLVKHIVGRQQRLVLSETDPALVDQERAVGQGLAGAAAGRQRRADEQPRLGIARRKLGQLRHGPLGLSDEPILFQQILRRITHQRQLGKND